MQLYIVEFTKTDLAQIRCRSTFLHSSLIFGTIFAVYNLAMRNPMDKLRATSPAVLARGAYEQDRAQEEGLIATRPATPMYKLALLLTLILSFTMPFTDVLCQRVHQRLANVVGPNAPELNRTQTGLLDAIVSPINRQGLEAIAIDDGSGRRRDVRLFYMPPTDPAAILTSKPAFCTSQVAKEPLVTDVSANLVRYAPGRRLTDDDLQRICGDGLDEQGLLRDMLLTDVAAILESVNIALWTQLVANFGAHYNTNSPAAVNVNLLTNIGNPIYAGMAQVIQGYRNIRGVGRPIVVGAGVLDIYMRSVQNGCCNDGGIDLSRAVGETFYFYDVYAQTAMANANHFAVLSPGVMHLVQWRKHQGPFQRIFDNSMKTTFIDPITGLEFELHLEWQGCEERWVWTVGMHFGIFNMPTFYPTPGPLQNTRGTLRFNAVQLP